MSLYNKKALYKIRKMKRKYAAAINTWEYGPPYEIYSFTGDREEMDQLLSGYYFAVIDDTYSGKDKITGFFAIGPAAQKICDESNDIFQNESYTDIAFGLRPDLTGKGLGENFMEACISKAKELFPGDGIRICVMKNNIRAIKLYEKMRFKKIFENHEYMIMISEGIYACD